MKKGILCVVILLFLPIAIWGGFRIYDTFSHSSLMDVQKLLPNSEILTHQREYSISSIIDIYSLAYDSINCEGDRCYLEKTEIDGAIFQISGKWFDKNKFFDVSLNPQKKIGYVAIYSYDPIIELIKNRIYNL